MNTVRRYLLNAMEPLVYGFSYGALRGLIRRPVPLDPTKTWELITRELPPFFDWWRTNYPPEVVRRLLMRRKLRQDHMLGISEHYDVSNDFFRLFLDHEYMFYSCADFKNGNETLEEAQSAKADFILRLINPKPGERILDLGCGWGAMLKRIHEGTGDAANLLGYTLSEEQVRYIRNRYEFNVELKNFITCDYEDKAFDKIYSIGAWEHVRPADIDSTLNKLFRALRPGGRMVKHFFCPLSNETPVSALVGQIFFPGSQLSGYNEHRKAFENAGFRITHQSIHDYRPTLRAWFDNLQRNRDRAIEMVGVETYNRYTVFFPASWRFFDDGEAILVRWVLEKPL